MAGEWRERPLGEITTNYDALRVPVKQADRRPGPYPYYGASGIVDYVDKFIFDGEYLLIAEDGENLRTRNTPVAFLARGRFWVNNHAHIVTGNTESDTRFIMYALSRTEIGGFLTGSAMPKLTQGNLNRIPLLTPPLPEQRAIAHVLGTLDDKIELNRRMGATLEAMAQALFKAWFVDFEPVRAKAEGRDPDLPPHLAALFPDRLVETEHRQVPDGWQSWTLGQMAAHHRTTLTPATEPDRTFEHYSIPAHDAGQEPALDRGESIKSNKTIVPDRAVLLSKLNPEISRVWIPKPKGDAPQVASTEFLCFTPKEPVGRALIYCLFKDVGFRTEMEAMVTGTSKSHQRISPSALLHFDAIAGSVEVFHAFEAKAWPLLDRALINRDESRTLAALRDTLLPQLTSGDLRVKDAETFLDRVI